MNNNQTQNNQYFIKKWIPAIISVAVVVAFLVFLILMKSDFLYFFIGIIVLTTSYAIIMSQYRRRKYRAIWQSSSPEEAVSATNRFFIGLKDKKLKEVILTYHEALIYLIYGEREKARVSVEKLDWSSYNPYQQSFKYIITTTDNYLYEDENTNGLDAAKKARDLTMFSSKFPGAKETIRDFDTNIVIGEIFTKGSTQDKIVELEKLYQESKPNKNPNMIAEWALAYAYKQIGDEGKSAEMLERCKKTVPFGVMLHKIKS